jgi:serine/threonine protein kinase
MVAASRRWEGILRPTPVPMTAAATTFKCPICSEEHPLDTEKCPKEGMIIQPIFRLHGSVIDGKYEILRVLGSGGMGIVYEGRHTLIGRKIAVKLLFPEIRASQESLARFQNEARIAASIAHKNIIDVFDMGTTTDKIPFIVMEYLLGYSLEQVLKLTTTIPTTMAVDILLEVLSALHAVHSRGIIHRDLKPDNVFLVEQAGGEDLVKVLDFGICYLRKAAGMQDAAVKTETGFLLGSPLYMAPEQALSEDTIDHRVDLYAVGVILYRMLTGGFPHEGSNYNQIIISIAMKDPVPPRQRAPHISPAMEELILRAIARDPDRRFSSAAEFAGYLAMFKSHGGDMEDAPSMVSSLPEEVKSKIHKDAMARRRPVDGSLPAAGPPAAGPGAGAQSRAAVARAKTIPMEIARMEDPSLPAAGEAKGMEFKVPAGQPWKGIGVFFDHETRTVTLLMSPDDGAGAPEDGKPRRWKVRIEGIPESASVTIDDVQHAERPILLEDTGAPRSLRIVQPGYKVWEKSVSVDSDTTFFITLVPLDSRMGLTPLPQRHKTKD